MKTVLLVVDEDPSTEAQLRRALADDEVEILRTEGREAALAVARQRSPQAALVEIRLPDASGLDLLGELRGASPGTAVVMATGHTTTRNAIEAMRLGAFDYLTKPFEPERLRRTMEQAAAAGRLAREVRYVRSELPPEPGGEDLMIGSSPEMIEIWKMVGKVAGSDATVLIQGESGTGKELLARAVYRNSNRSERPFLAVNCAALPESLLESELFGHEKGAFTDARQRRIGKFEQCRGGTLFLDEVSEMSPASQGKLLRVLENQTFERLGGAETIRADVRIVAATNRSLIGEVKAGRFRLDLFYRLRVVTFHLPPLRERPEDIPLLADLFLRQAAARYGKPVRGLAPEALRLLATLPWEGNIRELKNAVGSAVLLTTRELLLPEDFAQLGALQPAAGEPGREAADQLRELVSRCFGRLSRSHPGEIFPLLTADLERALVEEALRRCDGSQVAAARLLGISRNTLRRRLEA